MSHLRDVHRRTYARCAALGVTVPERERSTDPIDDTQTAILALRRAGHDDTATMCAQALAAAEDADLRQRPADAVPLGVGMRWPDCTAWLRRSAA